MNNTGAQTPLNRFSPVITILLGLFFVIGLSSCGGGGGSDDKPGLTINSPSVIEGDTGTVELVFTVTLDEDADSLLTVDYTTADDTATEADDDYTADSGQLTIPEGSRTASVSIFAKGDSDFEQNESFNLEISNPTGIKLSENSISGSGLIENDDDAVPKGYFTGTGTFNGTDYTDVTALVFDDRVLLFTPTANVQYDLAITPSVFDFTGTVEVYDNGNIQAGAVTVSGTTNELQIAGSFAGGTGFGAGSFDVAFDAGNNKGATLGRIEGLGFDRWFGNLFGIDEDTGDFASNSLGSYSGSDDTTENCGYPGITATMFVIPDASSNIYEMSHEVEDQGGMTCTYVSSSHTGFAAVVDDTGTDDKLVFAFNNGTIAMFGIMNK